MIQPERSELQDMIEAGIGIVILLIVITYFSLQLGVITFDEPAKVNITPNITESITEIPTTEPTPIPTIDEKQFMLEHNGYELREWVHWFRADVEGINRSMDTGDLSTWVTVWGYKFMPSYHYYSVSWGRNFLVKPDDKGDQFLFIYVNSYSDGDNVRQYGIDYNNFALQIGNRIYYPDFFDAPEQRITEFDDIQNYGRTESIFPYGYRRHQEKGTGIITAEKLEWLMGGRSNAWDGYIRYSIPYNVTAQDVHVIGSFANLAPQAYWQLR